MEHKQVLRWANGSHVTDHLWVGGDLEATDDELAAAQLDELDAVGITDVVDLRLEWNDQAWVEAAKPHMHYRWLGVDDAGQRMPDAWFDTGTAHVLARLGDGGTVLIHCHMGINRGPSMGFAVLLALGWDPVEALDRIRQARPIAYVAYAEDALDWWFRRSGASETERRAGMRRIRRWRAENYLDVANVIRRIRQKESA